MHARHLAVALLLALPAVLPAADTFDYVRLFDGTEKERGLWTVKVQTTPRDGDLVGMTLAADWWEGPGDARPGDETRAPMEGFVFEIRRGEGPWVPLAPVARDLRLTARAAVPAEAKTLLGGVPSGEWSVRQSRGAEVAGAVRLEFTLRGDPLLVTDLRVADVLFPDLDPPKRVGRPWIPDRTELRTLAAGTAVKAVVTVENCGARRTKECDLDLVAAPRGVRKDPHRLGFVQVPRLAPGARVDLEVSGKLPEEFTTGGAWELLAWVNPRGTVAEVEPLNNLHARNFTVVLIDTSRPPEDLRDR